MPTDNILHVHLDEQFAVGLPDFALFETPLTPS